MRRDVKFASIVCSVLLVCAVTANAAFKSSSTGKGTSKPAPPAVCVGDPGTNQPCVITDDSVAFGQVADLKAKVAAGTATKADFEALGITISASVDLDDADTIAYLNAKVNAIITSGNLTNKKKPSDLKSTIDAATTANVALWTIYQTASGASGYPTSGLTTSLLTNAGVSTTILSDTDTTISNLQSNITSSGLTSSLTATDVENWIADAAGFSSSTTYAQVQTATTNGWSIANFKTASGLGYTTSSADNTLFGQASGSTYTPHCQAEIDDSSASCTDLTKTQFESAKSGSALLGTKKTKVTAGTLTLADLTELGLTTTALGSSPADWELEYLMSQLGTGASVTKSDWQTTITAYDSATAALWKLAQIAAGESGHPTSDLTIAIIEAAGGTSGVATTVGATITQLRDDVTSSGLTTSSTGTNIDDWVTEAAGFNSSTTFATVNTAVTNGYTAANYKLAEDLAGWTTSATDATHFANCKASTNSATGGSGTCSATRATWLPLDTPTFASSWSCGGTSSTTMTTSCTSTSFSKGDSYSSSGTGIVTLTASDTDGSLTYSVSGTNSSSFSINSSTGAVTAASNLSPGTYNFNVVATDSTTAASSKAFTVTITDSTAPSIVGSSTVSASAINTYYTNGTTIYSAASKFSDSGTLTYSINNSKFSINSSTGVITKNGNITAEETITVTATDDGGNTANITLTVPFTTSVTIYAHQFVTTTPNKTDGCCPSGYIPMKDAWKDYSYWDNKTVYSGSFWMGGKTCIYGWSHTAGTRNIATWLDKTTTNCSGGKRGNSSTCSGSHNSILLCVDVTP